MRGSTAANGHARSAPDLRRDKAARTARARATREKYKNCWVPRVARVGEAVAARSRADLRETARSHGLSAGSLPRTVTASTQSSPPSSSIGRRQHRLQRIHGVKSPTRLGKSNLVHAPSDWQPPATREDMDALAAPPGAHLELYRARNGVGSAAVGELITGEFVFASGCVVVIQNKADASQRFFQEHNASVSCIAISPCGRFVASGQSRPGPIFVWDAIVAGVEGGEAVSKYNNQRHSVYHARYRRVHPQIDYSHRTKLLSQINPHSSSGVLCLDFSPDKVLLVSVGADNTIAISKWRSREIIATARSSTEIFSIQFNPFSCWPLPKEYEDDVERGVVSSAFHIPVAGQAFLPEDAFYNLCSVGKKHLKF